MNDHIRKRIRGAVVAALQAVEGVSVHVHRSKSFRPVELPAAVVATPSEGSEAADLDGVLDRTVDVVIDLFDEPGDVKTLADRLDDRARAVEIAMATDAALDRIVKSVTLTATETDPGGGEVTLGTPGVVGVRLIFAVRYLTAAADPAEVA